MLKKFAQVLLIIMIPAGLWVLLGLTSKHNMLHHSNGLQVMVDNSCGNQFVSPETFKELINSRFPDMGEQPPSEGSLHRLKQLVEGNPFVRRAAIFRTINGDICVKISQRDPLVRVINSRGQGFYIDREGKTMPLSDRYTARVMLASGHIQTTFSQPIDLAEAKTSEQISASEQRLRDLYALATYIDQSPLWRSLIDQILVTRHGHFELIPMNGAHVIEFGSLEEMEEKFRKLDIFYRTGIRQVGWNHYSRINLMYNRQVVCTK